MLTIIIISILIAIIFAPIGCLCLWKKYIYFTDGFAHASILISTISIIFNIPTIFSSVIFALSFAVAVFKYKDIIDGNVGICLISSLCLSLALVISYISPVHIDVNALLFGDIISVSYNDIIALLTILFFVAVFIYTFYQDIIMTLINQDIAKTMGVRVELISMFFLILLSFSVFTAMKIVGALMLVSMLLIPAICARIFATTPKQMIGLSIVFSIILSTFALVTSFYLDIPIAPLITSIGTLSYFIMRGCYDIYSTYRSR